MILFVVLIVAFMVLLSPSSAANTVKFVNHCPYDLYSWTVGPAGSDHNGEDHEVITIPANTVLAHGMINGEGIGGGIALKLRDLPKYRVAPAGVIQLEYNLEASKNNLWYDLSAIDCVHSVGPDEPSFCPLIRSGVKVHVENADHGRCPPAWCGANGCYNTFKKPGFQHGDPAFKCNAGTDIIIEICTERAGPRTFNGHTEPGHPAQPNTNVKPGHSTTNGVCGAKTPSGATCFYYAQGNCCSQYGWCGFSEAHCGEGCQQGFGDCFSQTPAQPSSYQLPSEPSTVKSSYENPTPAYVKPPHSYYSPTRSYSIPASSHYPLAPSYVQPSFTHTPRYSHIEHTWPSYSKHTPSYAKPSTIKSTSKCSEPTPIYGKPTASYYAPESSYTPPTKPSQSSIYSPAPIYSKPTPVYSKPTPVYSTPTPAYSEPTPVYSAPSSSYAVPASSSAASTPSYSPPYSSPYSPPPYHTIYATHTVTETHPQVTKTVTISPSSQYSAPTSSSVYHAPIYTHTLPQELQIPSTWYNKPSSSSVYDQPSTGAEYYPPAEASWAYDTPAERE